MHALAFPLGLLFLLVVLLDAFQTIILPRRPTGRLRITRVFFVLTWQPWRALTRLLPAKRTREQLYSVYGPLSLLLLFVVWAVFLTAAFALMYFGLHLPFHDPMNPVTVAQRMRSCFYVSGTTLFTLGLGDVQPATHAARLMIVLEAGVGLGFVALVIGYVPVLYTAFSNRELAVALLDARAGSPPTAGELLLRHNFSGGHHAMSALLAEWERWCAGILETHISYPILAFYRSQHDNQSWLAALTAVLDVCALLITAIEGPSARQAELTFAIGRHALVDLGHVFHLEQDQKRLLEEPPGRLLPEEYGHLCDIVTEAGFKLCGDLDAKERLFALRKLYEPAACALANNLQLELPNWVPPDVGAPRKHDAWSTVANLRSPGALADRLTTHVSLQATASRLTGEEPHP